MIYIEMERGANMYVGLQNINNAIDQIKFNVDIEEIFIRKIEFIMPTISFSINSLFVLFSNIKMIILFLLLHQLIL